MAGAATNINLILIIGGILLVFSIGFLIIGPKLIGKTVSILSIIGIIAIIGVGISLPQIVEFFSQPTRTGTLAKSEITPQKVNFIRVFSTEFTLTWETQSSVIGAIRYGTSPQDLSLAAAELDPSTNKTTHIVRVTDLNPDTTYYVEIISGGNRFNDQNKPYSIKLPSLNN